MRSNPDVKIACVAPALLGEMWPHAGPLLLKGQLRITPNMHTALTVLNDLLAKVHKGQAQVWVALVDGKVAAAMLSEMYEDEGRRHVWVSRLGGERILAWGKALSDALTTYAKAENADGVRFYGRRALERAYRGVRVLDDLGNNTMLYERAAS